MKAMVRLWKLLTNGKTWCPYHRSWKPVRRGCYLAWNCALRCLMDRSNAQDQARLQPSPEAGCSVACPCGNAAGPSGLCDDCFINRKGGSLMQLNTDLGKNS